MNTNICPLCNSFESAEVKCATCDELLEDKGRYIDYFDDYSAYLEIDDMKMVDGINNDRLNHQCPHVLYCVKCNQETVVLINEI